MESQTLVFGCGWSPSMHLDWRSWTFSLHSGAISHHLHHCSTSSRTMAGFHSPPGRRCRKHAAQLSCWQLLLGNLPRMYPGRGGALSMPTMAQTKRQRPANKTTPAIAAAVLASLSEAASPPPRLASSLQEAAPKEGKTESGGLRNKAFVG
ncbi:hypothetical protein XPA_008906 [Xanthoria parietina]